MSTSGSYHGLLRLLREECHPGGSVTVRKKALEGAWGECKKTPAGFVVYVEEKLVDASEGVGLSQMARKDLEAFCQKVARALVQDTLFEEWAHCLSFDSPEREGDHGPTWGAALSYCRTHAWDGD